MRARPAARRSTASYRGRLTYFEIVRPWDRPQRQEAYQPSGKERLAQALFDATILLFIVGAVLLARRNLRLGRGDGSPPGDHDVLLDARAEVAGGLPPDAPYMTGVPATLNGLGGLADFFHERLFQSVEFPLIALFVLLLFSVVLRKSWLVAVAGWLVFGLAMSLAGNYPLIDVAFGLAQSAVFAYLFVRHGLLSVMACFFVVSLCVNAPLTTDTSSWYFADCLVALATALALALYGFYTSLAGQPLFKGGLLE